MQRLPHTRALAAVLVGLGVVLVGLGPVAVPAPASAAVTGSTGSDDVVLYPQCQQHVVDYTITVSPGTTFWNLEIQVESPTGLQSEGSVFTSNVSSTTGTASTIFCGAEAPGTWTVHATGIYEFLPGVRIPYALPDSTFQVRRAATHTTLGAKRARHHRVKLVSTVGDERAGGFGVTEGATVELQRLVDGSWRKVRGSRQRTFHGHTAEVVRAVRGATYRAVTYPQGNDDGSTSAPVTIRSGAS